MIPLSNSVKLIQLILILIVAFGVGYYTAHHWEEL